MIIKTITCHDVYNCGASLHAYALMKYLENGGHNVEIINYKPSYLCGHYDLFAISNKWSKSMMHKLFYFSIKIPIRILNLGLVRKYRFDKFRKQYMNLTHLCFRTNKDLLEHTPYADVYIAGSDQIWNTNYENGKDPAFYLDFAPATSIKASYAASFSISNIADDLKPFVKKQLSKLNFISVRESTGVEILKYLNISGIQVCDPVFLIGKEQWALLTKKRLIKNKYILVYDFEYNKDIEMFTKKYAQENNLEIISIKDGPKLKYADKTLRTVGPIEFITLIRDCDCLVSNSFHGSAFALIFEKNFFVFKRAKQSVNSRMIDLLHSLNLDDRLITNANSVHYSNIDYNAVSKLINTQNQYSRQYINQFIK